MMTFFDPHQTQVSVSVTKTVPIETADRIVGEVTRTNRNVGLTDHRTMTC